MSTPPHPQNEAPLLRSHADGITTLTIHRPARRNALDAATLDALAAALHEAARDDTRVVVLTGAGDAFCAGADLAAIAATEVAKFDVTAALRTHTNPVILALRALPKPVIARVHGSAVGLGMSLALACDLVLASEQAVFGQAFVKLGLMPDGGSSHFLVQRLGYQRAFELIALGEHLGARDAERLGLVNRVVPLAELDAAVAALAGALARGPRVAYAEIKAGLQLAERCDLATALDHEAAHQAVCARSPDFAEGVTAFLQKRAPKFG